VLKILILSVNVPKWWFSDLNFAFMDENFLTKREFSDKFPTAQNLGGGQFSWPRHHCFTYDGVYYFI